MRVNQTRERLPKAKRFSGADCRFTGPRRFRAPLPAAGFDYVFIDMEHGAYNLETVQDMIKASSWRGHHADRARGRGAVHAVRAAAGRARRASFCRAWKIPRCSKRR